MFSLSPLFAVAGTFLVVMLADTFVPEGRKVRLAWIAGVGLVVALALVFVAAPPAGAAAQFFNGTVAGDSFALFFQALFLLLTLAVLVLSPAYLRRRGIDHGEYYVLLVASLLGMMVLVAATNLMTVFIGIELLSISLYVLSGFLRSEEASQEAGLKYLLMGGFASGFLLYGMALLYGGTGATDIVTIGHRLGSLHGDNAVFALAGVALVLVGLAFKSSAAPFHAWTPDVYQGAPAPVVAFMSVGTKVAAIAAFLRVFAGSFAAAYSHWSLLLGAVAAASMLVGAVGALRQDELKRMLAYSSIAQAGYLLLAVLAGGQQGLVSGLFFLAVYGFMTFGAFAVVTLLSRAGREGVPIQSLRGLGLREPLAGGALAVFMISLAGLPPTAGFMGKLFVFRAAIGAGLGGLTLVAIVASAISLYYYLRVVVALFTPGEAGQEPEVAELDPWGMGAVGAAATLTLLIGIFPGLLYQLAQRGSLL